MSTWPANLKLEPLDGWPGELKTRRKQSKFKATPAASAAQIRHEVAQLKGSNIRLQIAARRDQFTLDMSRLRANERPWHPGIVLVFDTPAGVMRYPCDTYPHWADNLRAIAVTLELLRSIDRHGVTTGQQYQGFLQIESGIAMPAGVKPNNDWSSEGAAIDYLIRISGVVLATDLRKVQRWALRNTHPDFNPSREDEHGKVKSAIDYLTAKGRTVM